MKKSKRRPQAIARNKWMLGDSFRDSSDQLTLGGGERAEDDLRNRLEFAFSAGWNAAVEHFEQILKS